MTSLECFLSNYLHESKYHPSLFVSFRVYPPHACHMMHPEKVSSCVLHGVCTDWQ